MILSAEISRLKSKIEIDSFIEKHFDGDPALFITAVNTALNDLLQSDLKKAGQLVQNLKPCFKSMPEYHRARFLAIEARHAHRIGKIKIALRKYKSAVERLQRARNFDAAARARQGLMDAYMYLGQYPEALKVGKRALAFFRRKGNDFNAARVMTNIGNVYHRLDRNKLALRYYEQAREIFAPAACAPLAILDFNRANIYANLNHLEKAEGLYKSAAGLFRENGMGLAVDKAEYSLAYLHFLADKFTTALTMFERVLGNFEKTGDNRAVAITRLDLAEINIHLNQFGSAVMLGKQAFTSCRKLGLRYEQAKAAFFVAEAYRRFGDYEQAFKYLRSADKLFKREENRLWQGMVQLERCRLKTATRRFNDAISLATAARRFFRVGGDERRRIDAEITMVEIHLGAGHPDKAIRLGERLLRCRPVSYQQHVILNLMGMAWLDRSESETALKYFNRAIEIIEKMLVNIYPDEIRFFFALDKYPTYLAAVNCLLELKRDEESFLKYSRAMAVLNQRCIPAETLHREVPGYLIETRAALRASLKKMGRVPDTEQRQISVTGNMYNAEHRLWDIERKIRSHIYPPGKKHELPGSMTGSYSDWLRHDEALLSFASTDRGIGTFWTDRSRTLYIDCPVDARELEGAIRELHFLMEKAVYAHGADRHSTDAIDYYLRCLFDWLIAPLNLTTKTKSIILVLDGSFAQIPFPALLNSNSRWLKDLYDIRIIVNPQDLQSNHNQKQFSDQKSDCAIFAPDNTGLPLVENEGLEIKRLFPKARLYSGETANIGNFKNELSQSGGFVHIATHASRSSENPLFSRILMSDGPFFPFDLFGTGIKAHLVTLSGCQTAAPGIYYGNSFSLAKAFYQGGAEKVLASLWPISDKISMVFMAEFYKALKQHGSIMSAYGIAVNKAFDINNNPAFWGPFVLLGL